MLNLRPLAVVIVAIAILATATLCAKKKKKGDEDPPTQVLELPKDPPPAVKAETQYLSFQVSQLLTRGLLSAQVREGLRTIVRNAHGGSVARIRAFVAGTGDMRRVQALVSEVFTEKKMALPALTVVQVGGLLVEGAQVSIESISVEKKIMNPNGLAFISGQQVTGQPMQPVAPLVQQSIGRLLIAAKAAGSEASDVVRVTCFVTSLEDASQGESLLHAAFPTAALTYVQGRRAPVESIAECEAVARLRTAPSQPVEFRNPAGIAPSPTHSQLVLVNAPRLALTGTQLAFQGADEDVRLAFQRLVKALETVDAKPRDVVAASIYPLSRGVSGTVRKIGLEFFDPARPPVTTAPLFEGLPSLDAAVAIDVVAVAP